MELRHLRYLIAVAEEQTFVAAAHRLALAQPALSRQIKDLEKEIGVELFARESTGTRLTAAGDACVRNARRIVDDLRAAVERARHAEHGLVGKCILGAGRYPLWNGLLGRLVEQIRAEYPGIDIIIDERSLRSQWDALANCDIDIAFGTAPPTEYMQFVVETHSLDIIDAIAVAKTHPLAERTQVALADLEPHTWLRHSPMAADEPTRILQSVLTSREFAPRSSRHAANDDALRMLVRAGAGWSALPRSLRSNMSQGMVAIPVEDLAVPFRYVHFHRRGDNRPVVRSVLGALRRAARREGYAPIGREPDSGIKPMPDAGRDLVASRLELRHLRYFVATIQNETIGRAADHLEITQPALSRQLRDLEEAIGASLLNRAARGVTPTLAGETLYSDAIRILRSTDQLAHEAHRALRGAAGHCVVAIAPTPLIWDVITSGVAELAQGFPDIDVTVDDIPTPLQTQALMDGRSDIAIGHFYPALPGADGGIGRIPLLPDTLSMALVSVNHPLAAQGEVDLADLATLPFLFMERDFSPGFYDYIMSTFYRAHFVPRIEGEFNGLPTVWALAAQGLGWCLGSASQKDFAPAGLVALRIRDLSIPWGCEMSYRRDETRPAVLEALRSIREASEKIHDEGMASQRTKYWPGMARTG
jgi:DNA-binding transcriptional LysR family regulator